MPTNVPSGVRNVWVQELVETKVACALNNPISQMP